MDDERAPLLTTNGSAESTLPRATMRRNWARIMYSAVILVAFFGALAVVLFYVEGVQEGGERGGHGADEGWTDRLPKDPKEAAKVLLKRAPVIDGHVDLPWLVRATHANNVSAIDLAAPMPGHVDIPRLRAGGVGAFFWSVYVPCAHDLGLDDGEGFLNSTWRVRDTLEQIDISHLLLNKFSDTFTFALTSADIIDAIRAGKIAGIIGLEGGHHLGNSLQTLRAYFALGARYMTLTHTCDNAFATSSGLITTGPGPQPKQGLSSIGRALIREMNRLGMLVDLSHVSDATALDALDITRAPVIWSHSSSRALRNIPRNVPDSVLERVGEGEGQVDGVVMVNFAPGFIADDPDQANLTLVADHVEHMAGVMGRRHVGIGSDFDGIGSTPHGLEDVSKYPDLVAELFSRGWSARELGGLTGGNLLRVMAGAERVAAEMQHEGVPPATEIWKYRQDLPGEL